MKLGIVSAIYDGFTFEEAVENAVKNGCECMEVACIEVEDKAFESSKERILDSVALSCRYMRRFVI